MTGEYSEFRGNNELVRDKSRQFKEHFNETEKNNQKNDTLG